MTLTAQHGLAEWSPFRFNARPRNQLPLAEAESLHPAKDAFDLTCAFRDGQIDVAFGTPGLPGGEVPTIHLQVAYELSHVLTGKFGGKATR